MTRVSQRRPRPHAPYIVGLTGSIAMGKSTAAKMIRDLGIPVFDADAVSRALTAHGGAATPAVAKRFPGVIVDGRIDRQALAKLVFTSPIELAALEAILHPLVRANRRHFLHRSTHRRARRVLLAISLLFEKTYQRECDRVLVVSAPAFLQRQRALARPGMDDARLTGVLKHQMPDAKKRRLADAVIPSGLGRALTLRRLKKALFI